MVALDPHIVRQFDRLPPHSVEAEMCVLCSLVIGGTDAALVAETRAGLSEGMFFQADHQIIYGVICGLLDRRGRIDGMLLREELIKRQLLEDVGGTDYLMQILTAAPSATNGPEYARIVRRKAGLRELIRVASDTLQQCYAPQDAEEEVIAIARRVADEAASIAVDGAGSTIIALSDAVDAVLGRRTNPGARRVPTGLRSLDDVLSGGLPLGKFTIVAADPKVGKSQLIKQILLNIARRGESVGLVTVEEDREKVAENLIANVSGIPNHKIVGGKMSPEDWNVAETGAVKLLTLPFFIEDSVSELSSIRTAIQRLALKHGCRVIAVDHLHIIDGNEQHRESEVRKISGGLKQEFKRMKVAGLVAAQLNRGDRQQRDKPTLRGLKDSKCLEADGDVIMLLHREDSFRYNEDGYTPTKILEVNIAKQKDGPMAEVPLYCDGASQAIADIVHPVTEDPWA